MVRDKIQRRQRSNQTYHRQNIKWQNAQTRYRLTAQMAKQCKGRGTSSTNPRQGRNQTHPYHHLLQNEERGQRG